MSKFPEQSMESIADLPLEERHAIVRSWLDTVTTFYQQAAAERDSLRNELASAHEHVGALIVAIEHEQSALDTYDVTRGEAAEDALEVARVNARSARNAARAWLRRAAQ